MGKLEGLTIVKLGGSLITHKDKSLTPNAKHLKIVSREIAKSKISRTGRLFLIHGGGSYGHYYAFKFGLTKVAQKHAARAISKTAEAMIDLHSVVLEHLNDEGLNCKTFLTSEFLTEDCSEFTSSGLENLENICRSGLVPLSFGNVFLTRKGSKIVSGDQIALALARTVKTVLVVFAMDVDGIYRSPSLKPPIIDFMDETTRVASTSRKYDVTGGIDAKIAVGLELRDLGANVFYVSGWKKQRLQRLLSGSTEIIAT